MDLKSKIILIYGPTASGKSDFAVKLAKKIDGEIINADSMQVYKELKVLSARPFKKDYKKINLLIIEFHNISENFKKIEKFISKGRYKLIHIHGNNYAGLDKFKNPNVIECTFINNEKFKVSRFKSKYKYPIPDLDFKNFKRREDIEINFND